MTSNAIITVLLVLLAGILVRDRLRGTAKRARAGLGSTISGFDPAETTMSDDNMFEEEDPTVPGSLAWMRADADPTNVGSTAWQIADSDPTDVGSPAWLDEQVLHDHPHAHDDWMHHHHDHNSDW
ncbi:hypothetical protein [Burkholderia cepacia]|uniref:hypothetical protein n=1 Tax=Burkholderia cepacia TaxID=292 RepID=UPI002AB75531|nr:hypothetical protein [Burkholderia cepacia]